MDNAADTGHAIALSPIILAEIGYLVEKNRLPASAYADLKIALVDPDYVIEEAPFNDSARAPEESRQGLDHGIITF